MKQNTNRRILSIVPLLLVVCLLMTSCMGTSSYENFLKAHEKNQGSSTQSTTNGADKLPPVYNEIVIEGGDASNVTFAAATGLRSAVSIIATYRNEPLFGDADSVASPIAGSGVIYSLEEDGSAFIITNFHVVYYDDYAKICNEIEVYLYGMENVDYAIPATYVGGSDYYDLAVLRIEKSAILKAAMARGSVAAVKIANSDETAVGQTAIAIGNAEAQGTSVTKGIISVDSEYITMNSVADGSSVSFRVVRMDTAVNSGNSGGGLFNDKGELIGIVNAKIINSKVENIGYAIPSNVVRGVVDNVIDHCYGKTCKTVMRAMLGITVINSGLSTYYDTESGKLMRVEEVTVQEVTADSLGSTLLKVGDVIKSIGIGERTVQITRQYQLIDFLLDARVGDVVKLTVLRNGVETTGSVTLTATCMTAY